MNKVINIAIAMVFCLSCMGIVQMSHAKNSPKNAEKKTYTADSKKPEKKKKDKYKYPKIIGQLPSGFIKMIVKDDYIYIALKQNITRMSVQGGKLENLLSVEDRIRGFALDDENIYFTVDDRLEIWKTILSGGKEAVFADLQNVENYSKSLYALAVDEEHVYCVQGFKLLRIAKTGGEIHILADQNYINHEVIWLDDEHVYWGGGSKVYMRQIDRDIAKVYTFKSSVLINSMAGNAKAFYYANNETVKIDVVTEVIFEEKKYVEYPIPALRKSPGSSIGRNSISCDEEQVYVAANSGVWYKKTGGEKFKVVEDTKNLDCDGMANDDQYIYFIIDRSLFKMTKPKSEV